MGSRARPCEGMLIDNESVTADQGEPRVFRAAGVSYLRIPAEDPRRTAAFYESVFGWTVDTNRPDPSFEDGTGHVIGHFVADQSTAGEAGVRPYVYVESLATRSRRSLPMAARWKPRRIPREISWYPPSAIRPVTSSEPGSAARATERTGS
jgi:hypothetical protein